MEARLYRSNSIKNGGYPTDTMFHIKDPGSSITHFIGFICAILATPGLLIYAASSHVGLTGLVSLSVFMVSMILLYGASTAYHTFIVQPHTEKILKRIDHMMIFVLIAGSYTPVCAMVLSQPTGTYLLAAGFCRNDTQAVLGDLSEMVFLYHLYRYGLGLRFCHAAAVCQPFSAGLSASGYRRNYLYRRRRHLRHEAEGIQ